MAEKRKRSALWLHFSEIGEQKAKCDICKAILSYRGGTTSNLRKHLKSKHPTISLEDRAQMSRREITPEEQSSLPTVPPAVASTSSMQETSPTGMEQGQRVSENIQPRQRQTVISSYATRPMSVLRQKKIDHLVLAMIVKDLQPFSIVEDEGFRDLLAGLDKSYTPPSRTTLSREMLPRIYDDVLERVKASLQRTEFITLTTDTWTSTTTESYMAITAHFISDTWEMSSCLVDCFKMSERHTAENLKNEIYKAVDDWGIRSKIHAIVTDNAANITAAARQTGWYHLPCVAHTINLVVQDSLKLIKNIHTKVKRIVEYFHRSSVATEKLKSFQAQMNPECHSLKLINDVITRWNSTLDMFERIHRIQEPVEAALAVLHVHGPVEAITSDEWETIGELSKVLKPFKQATTELSSEKVVSASKIIIIIQGIIKYLMQIRAGIRTDISKTLLEELLKNLNIRFGRVEHNKVLSRSTFLDPRFKTKAFEDSSALSRVREDITSACTQIVPHSERPTQEIAVPLEREGEERQAESDVLWGDFDKKVSEVRSTPTSAAIVEVRQYVEEPYLDRKEDPLKWWKSRALVYPALARQAKRHLGVVATSVPSERIFSLAGETVSDRRCRLSPENVKKIIFLNANKKYMPKYVL